ncbi:DNA mismatch repair protein MutL [Cubamyces sp. BRFM 1775]|nr:DNA mismatch repair protein MutL [Cubamyces sp. BRFM 1775]
MSSNSIKVLDGGSIHKITSGQVVVDLQTAVKELVENSLDAGATTIEVRFKNYGLESFEVIDNGSGIAPADYDSIALKHHTSKLSSFTDLEAVKTFGFRGEALSSLCALAESVSVTTATATEAPVGTVIEFERTGKAKDRKGKAARQRGTTVTVTGLFKPLPVRRKELERNVKREFGKALTLLHAYALVPCAKENKGVRLTVTNQLPGGKKSVQLRTEGVPSTRASVSAIWGPKTLDSLVDLELAFNVEVETAVLRRLGKTRDDDGNANEVKVRGLVSKFAVGCGRNGTDRQFFFVNGRPCAPSKVQKAFNEVYRSFNATQSPFIIADFILPTNSCDINVSPDKRTILLHSENNLVQALKAALEETYAPARSTFDVQTTQAPVATLSTRSSDKSSKSKETEPTSEKQPLFLPDEPIEDELVPPVAGSSTEATMKEQPMESTADSHDEITFGEPSLLSEPSLSADMRQSSQDAQNLSSSSLEEPLRDDDGAAEGEAPATEDQQEEASSGPSAVAPRKASRPAPSSPTITQMLGKKHTAPTTVKVASDVLNDDDEDSSQPSTALRTEYTSSRSSRSSAAAVDPPVPTLKPPARPIRRTSSQPGPSTRGGEQMVLNTSGALWNLRRPAETPNSAERPRKKSRVDGDGDDEEQQRGSGREARKGMRQLLRDFARKGSVVEEAPMDVDEEADEDEAQEETGEEPIPSVNEDQMEVEANELLETLDDPAPEGITTVKEVVEIEVDEESVAPSQSEAHTRSDLGGSSTTTAVSEEIVRTGDREATTLAFDMSHVAATWKKLQSQLAAARQGAARRAAADAQAAGIVDVADDEATETLSRVIEKTDFASMDIVGQFNLGFIIVRRRKIAGGDESTVGEEVDDLFIVDQHAADEKYNFETLQQTTKIDSQKLFHPQVLELTAADELVALENFDVLRQNGFELEVIEDRPPGQRVQLTAQPISKSTVFDMKDLEELLHRLQGTPSGQMVRCSKARAMFAMRACRKSIMIGTPLSRRQMTSVVQHMGTMDQPWHCPHGRPTMRHLTDISGMGWDRRQGLTGDIDWTAFRREST